MYNILIPSLLVLIYWTIPSFIQKYYLLNDLTAFELTVNNWLLGGIFGITLLLISNLFKNKFKYFDLNYNFNKNIKYFPIICSSLLIALIGTISYFYLIKISNNRKVISYLNPINILLVVLISFFIFKEKITYGSIIGIFIVIIGLIIVYCFEK
jgi:uncharacterized membrane protein